MEEERHGKEKEDDKRDKIKKKVGRTRNEAKIEKNVLKES